MRQASHRSSRSRLRTWGPLAVALALCAPLGPRAAWAEAEEHGEPVCDASATDEQCHEYWEHHINWWSTDYKAGPNQDPSHRHMPPPFGMALINFGIFAMVMFRLAGKPLTEAVRTRHLRVKKELEEAAALRQAASEKLREYENRLAKVDAEIDALVAQLRTEAEAEKAQMIANAEAEAVRVQREAEAQIATEMLRIQRRLKQEVVEAAFAAAEKFLREGSRPDDQKKFAEQYLAEMDTLASDKKGA